MRLFSLTFLAILMLTGCVITPYGGATLWWKTEYVQNASWSVIKRFRDGEILNGSYAACDSLKNPPPYTCTCQISRADPSEKVQWAWPHGTEKQSNGLSINYLARNNSEPASFDDHPYLQYAFSERSARVWFYDLRDRTLKSRELGAETRSDQGDTMRTRLSQASYVHIGSHEIFYFAAVEQDAENYLNQRWNSKMLPPATIYQWAGAGKIRPERGFLVWKAVISNDGVIGPLLIADKEGLLAATDATRFTHVVEEQLPAYTPGSPGMTEQLCLATIHQGDICSYRDHGIDGSNSRSDPICVPFSEELAAKIRLKESRKPVKSGQPNT